MSARRARILVACLSLFATQAPFADDAAREFRIVDPVVGTVVLRGAQHWFMGDPVITIAGFTSLPISDPGPSALQLRIVLVDPRRLAAQRTQVRAIDDVVRGNAAPLLAGASDADPPPLRTSVRQVKAPTSSGVRQSPGCLLRWRPSRA